MKSKTSMELVILNGPQSGAHVQFNEQGTLSIGGDISNDIILRDSTISDHKIRLSWSDGEILLEVLSGNARSINAALEAGEQIILPAYTPVQIGETVFAIGLSGSRKWKKVVTTVPAAAPTAAYQEDESENIDYVPEQTPSQTPLTLLRLMYSGSVLMVLLGMTVFYFQPHQTEGSIITESSTIDTAIRKLSIFLQDDVFAELQFNRDSENILLITGYVDKKASSAKLDDFIYTLDLNVEKDIEIGDNLGNLVQDVFRLNRIEANVRFISRGIVEVNTVENDLEALKKAELLAYRDLPQLKTLQVKNQIREVKVEQKKIADKKAKNKPVKPGSIVMITPGPPAFLLTSDHSKYYVGSKLPSGHKITRIKIDKVFLSKEGEKTIVKF